jgi:hypothetical protein
LATARLPSHSANLIFSPRWVNSRVRFHALAKDRSP